MATVSAWSIIAHSQASTHAIEQILKLHNLQNEGSQALDQYTKHHPILGTFLASPARHTFELPTSEESSAALNSEVPHLVKTVGHEASAAAWWSCFFLNASLLYAIAVILLERSFTARWVLASLTGISVVFFMIGILAPAMIIWTAPSIPIEAGHLKFVLQHEVRGIAVIIRELFTSGHWVIGGFLFLFSILTPLTKAGLSFFVTASPSRELNRKIGHILHSIGKWSMADVFVAGVLLALYALKSQEATRSIPCIGLAYFIGYCLLSMTTAELLTHSEAAGGEFPEEKKLEKKGSPRLAIVLAIVAVCFAAGSISYTFAQYPLENMGGKTQKPGIGLPQKLREADLTRPASK
ncbi:Paraquat-inducible protein A [Verrucomicrobium sp. GAS474]|uniref:paraquat-inducible protein A n=1 Tax=Verrucomicrobium sp. GAS474 TaxID=1882831 RepID=UPI000879CF8E|nr:paraquat-inducible protein A [Verrucomicrobium sp. GAS474]SDU12790.1 Paraquat-inducible protein A [Verrucomicrobium sp. GAS474]